VIGYGMIYSLNVPLIKFENFIQVGGVHTGLHTVVNEVSRRSWEFFKDIY